MLSRKFLAASCLFFQAEDGIRDLVRSRGLGDVYKRQDGVIVTLCADKVSDAIANERRRQLKKSSSGTPSNLSLIHI